MEINQYGKFVKPKHYKVATVLNKIQDNCVAQGANWMELSSKKFRLEFGVQL